jgi:hypothetical protein
MAWILASFRTTRRPGAGRLLMSSQPGAANARSCRRVLGACGIWCAGQPAGQQRTVYIVLQRVVWESIFSSLG